MTAPPPINLNVVHLAKHFDTAAGRVEVLKDVSFGVQAGQALAVLGPSGAGKSTLLHVLGTLDTPSAGRVEIGGLNPFDLADAELARFRNRSVGFVFQDHHLLPQYTLLENVLLPTLAFGPATSEAEARARQLLDRVRLSHRVEHRPAQLSGGERQRGAIARALIQRPGLLLCDEPTGNLDATSARTVSDLLFELHREESNILIVITHNLELAARFDHRLRLLDGRCAAA